MGETVEFASNGASASGYLARPASGSGPGVIVLQEWWGLAPELKVACDRLADAGFVALAPDLYHGEVAAHDEMDKAGRLMTTLPQDRAAKDMCGAVDYLLGLDATTGGQVGVTGFCMGGMLSLSLAALCGDQVGAVVPFYGFPQGDAQPDWSGLTAPIEGHMAESDDFFPPEAAKDLESRLKGLGKDVELIVYPGTGHAFASGHNALGTHDEAASDQAWGRAIAFLHEHLG